MVSLEPMRAVLTAVIAAIEAAAVAVAVFALIAVPSILVWWLVLDLGAEPAELAAIVLSIWQLSHFVPMNITLAPEVALGLGLHAETLNFTLSLAPLGLTLVSVVLAIRSGWRFAAQGGVGAWSIAGGAIGFAVAATVAALYNTVFALWPLFGEVVVPTVLYALSCAIGFVARSAREGEDWWLSAAEWLIQRVESALVTVKHLSENVAETVRLAAAGLLALLGLAAIGTCSALLFGYVDIMSLGQSLHLDALGAVMLFVAQLVLLPIAWIWGMAWFAGPGFSIGTATSVSPFDTLVGPLPSLPLFGAIPDAWGWAGGLAPMLVVALAAALGGFAGGRSMLRTASRLTSAAIPMSAAVLAGLAVVVITALATGSIGPGRLEAVGPAPWVVGLFVTIELGFGMTLGVFARKVDLERLRDMMPEAPPGLVKHDIEEDAVTQPIELPARLNVEPPSSLPPEQLTEETTEIEQVDPLLAAFSWETGEQPKLSERKYITWRDRVRSLGDARRSAAETLDEDEQP